MARDNAATARIFFEHPIPYAGAFWPVSKGVMTSFTGGSGPVGTRKVFPQVSPDLSVRWCSAYLKIDVCAAAIRNQNRFQGRRVLVVTGERAEESPARAKYKTFEPHRADLRKGKKRRHVDQWRPVHAWTRQEVWAIIERYKIASHPGYRLGWGRLSCAACIFGDADQWASLRKVNPKQFSRIVELETASGKTIKRKLSVIETAAKGKPYIMKDEDIRAALATTWNEPMIVNTWTLPAGAYGDSNGPT
jgi:3'-phosphoadenosine 5'-phosphosulfate sulfotransferase (PAPS reductase)/FAD synthetase